MSTAPRRVLILGAGLVVKPLLDDLLQREDVEVELAALNVERIHQLLAGHPRAHGLELDSADTAGLNAAVGRAQVVVSLLPADQHVRAAEACLEHGAPLITSSYVSPAMRALDDEARRRGVLLLNEAGLDPGIDHAMASRAIRRIEAQGGCILGYQSYCAGLPEPKANANPWGYKLSWTPRGVLLAARGSVRFLAGGEVVERDSPYAEGIPQAMEIAGVGRLEGYPNRDSLAYREVYGLGNGGRHQLRDLIRGTLRYPGWCQTMRALLRLGLLSLDAEPAAGLTYAQWLATKLPAGDGGLVARLAATLGLDADDDLISRLEWLGLLSDRPLDLPSRSDGNAAPLDILAQRLQHKLQYQPGERDLVILEHRLRYRLPGGQEQQEAERLVLLGEAGDNSAMATTVSLPAAIACHLLLDGRLDLKGVHIPTVPALADAILAGLAKRGIRIEEGEG